MIKKQYSIYRVKSVIKIRCGGILLVIITEQNQTEQNEERINILDTSTLIDDPMAIYKFGKSIVVIPSTVIEELNDLKDDKTRLRGETALIVLKELDKLTAEYPDFVDEGIPLENGGKLVIELNHKSLSALNGSYDKLINDNRILAVAKNYTNEESTKENRKVVLVSNDTGLRVKGRSLKILSEGYDSDKVINNKDEIYKGFKELFVNEHTIADYYRNGYVSVKVLPEEVLAETYENEFVILKNEMNTKNTAIGRIGRKNGALVIKELIVKEDTFIYGIKALDSYQMMALELLLDPEVSLVCLNGKAGSGKTLLALAAGLKQLEEGRYRRILALRTLVVVGKKEVGFLPGDLEEKLKPFMAPFYDNLEFLFDNKYGKSKKNDKDKNKKSNANSNAEASIQELNKIASLEKILAEYEGRLVIESTGFMRGRTLPNQFVVVDEAQNLSKHEAKTLVTRIGDGGKIILMGDIDQIDDPYLNSTNNGLVYVTEKMKDLGICGTVFLSGKSKRSLLAELASERL